MIVRLPFRWTPEQLESELTALLSDGAASPERPLVGTIANGDVDVVWGLGAPLNPFRPRLKAAILDEPEGSLLTGLITLSRPQVWTGRLAGVLLATGVLAIVLAAEDVVVGVALAVPVLLLGGYLWLLRTIGQRGALVLVNHLALLGVASQSGAGKGDGEVTSTSS